MNICEEAALKRALLPLDAECIEDLFRHFALLIDQSPFSEKIWFLIINQHLSEKSVLNVKGETKPPNCLGTAFFVAGVSQIDYPYHAYDDELGPHMRQRITGAEIPEGAFCFSPNYEPDGVDYHAGIYLGKIWGAHTLFAQHGKGCRFGVESLKANFINPEYYLPGTLSGRQ